MLDKFIDEYSVKGYQFAYRLCGNAEEAKELVQETFVRLLRRWDHYDQSQSLENYFLSILRHLYYDGLKRYDRRFTYSLDCAPENCPEGETFADMLADGETDLLDLLERRQNEAVVEAAFDSLSPEYRAVITLCDVQGLNYDQIAQVLDCPGGTVRSRLSRARQAFKRKILELSEVRK